jgi:unsaturated rhamnogalacturonyl hydrolase
MKSCFSVSAGIAFLIITLSTSTLADEFSPDSIIGITKRVANYHMKSGPIYPNTWDGGAYLTGIMAMYRLTKDPAYLNFAKQWAVKFKWLPAVTPLTTVADDICCFQTYCEIHNLDPRPENDSMIANVRANLENLFYVVKPPQPRTLWSWDDALYMAPASVSRYCSAIKNNAFIDSLNRYWWDVSASLYDTTYHLWYRDGGFKSQKAANGQPLFWSCGVAWVMGGMTRVLQDIPLNHPQRDKWLTQFREMSAAIKAEQGFNALYSGLWTTSMRDHTQWPDPESSASSFFCFGLAWGINNRVLDSAQYIDCVRKAWRDLVANVGSNGMLRRCQTVNWQPASVGANNSSVEGEAAFMLAGEEMWKLASGYTVSAQNKSPAVQDKRCVLKPLIITFGKTGAVDVPSDVRGVEIFTLQGKSICRYGVTSGGRISVPNNPLKNSVYVVKYFW